MGGFGGSFHNLQALVEGDVDPTSNVQGLEAGGPLSFALSKLGKSRFSGENVGATDTVQKDRVIIVANHLPLRAKLGQDGKSWEFEWDEDALTAQAKEGIDDADVIHLGCLPVEVDPTDEERVQEQLINDFSCIPVFLGRELKEKYYKGFCKLQLWPLFHYNLPLSPLSSGRFSQEMWQAYVKANKAFTSRLVEFVSVEDDFIWIHDYHLLVLPSMLRRRLNKIRCGLFLHSPFPSSEIFRTFPKRDEVLRSLLNADLLGFHTFDYARHFLSCCSRMLGLEHITSRGSITIEYYGRNVGVKIMPTGIKPDRLLSGYAWDEYKWRRGELIHQFEGKKVMMGIDDMDVFKGIELKIQAMELMLEMHREWVGRAVLVQIVNPARSSGRDVQELREEVIRCTDRVNGRFGGAGYQPVVLIERSVPLYERIAYYSIADVVVVTALRDGMNLVPYEYIVSRQGPDGVVPDEERHSMLVVSEFVGCSPSLSGAIRVNPWSLEAVADGMYAAVKMPKKDCQLRHQKHWRYVSSHTVSFWAQSFCRDLKNLTIKHSTFKCYALGLGLDSFRMVALDANFRKLDFPTLQRMYNTSRKRVFLLDYDGTLVTSNSINDTPSAEVLRMLRALCAEECNRVYVISGRRCGELTNWFAEVPNLGLAAENGFFFKETDSEEWLSAGNPEDEASWRELAIPIMETYSESTDGSYVDKKDSSVVWHYGDADPDFGHWQAKELLDHLDHTLYNEPVDVVAGQNTVEVKPAGSSKGQTVEGILNRLASSSSKDAALDFVLCIGDDRSDEDMFAAIESVQNLPHMKAEVCSCTVGQKPSKAPYYLNDTQEVVSMLYKLVQLQSIPEQEPAPMDTQASDLPAPAPTVGLKRTK
uniref:Trehalose 6-phosphate synthase/phosphatase n=1 Tax=Tetraselmis sp. GSL018 TaxID=582737 RepID=A0A061RG97_9CHLO